MKQIKILAALALVAAITLPAMAETKVTFSGSAKARVGMQYMHVDKNDWQALALLAGLAEDKASATVFGALSNTQNAANTAVAAMDMPSQRQAAAAYYAVQNSVTFAAALVTLDTAYSAGSNTIYRDNARGAIKGKFDAVKYAFMYQGEAQAVAAMIATTKISNTDAVRIAKEYFAGEAQSSLFWGLKKEQAVRLDMKVEDDKLTAKIGAELSADATKPFDLKIASLSYDYGIGAITYNDAGMQGRWNADLFYIGDNNVGMSSLDLTFKPGENMGNAFFTLMSNKALSSSVKYENVESRLVPIMQLGYEYKSDMLDFKAGGVYDKYRGNVTRGDAILGEAETQNFIGYLAFGTVTYKMGDITKLDGDMSMAISASGMYGKNVSNFAPMKSSDIESASISLDAFSKGLNPLTTPQAVTRIGTTDMKVMGFIVGAGFTPWKGGLISGDYRYSVLTLKTKKNDGEDFSRPMEASKAQLAITQYFSKNFYVLVGGGTESYSTTSMPGIDAAYGYEVTCETGFKF